MIHSRQLYINSLEEALSDRHIKGEEKAAALFLNPHLKEALEAHKSSFESESRMEPGACLSDTTPTSPHRPQAASPTSSSSHHVSPLPPTPGPALLHDPSLFHRVPTISSSTLDHKPSLSRLAHSLPVSDTNTTSSTSTSEVVARAMRVVNGLEAGIYPPPSPITLHNSPSRVSRSLYGTSLSSPFLDRFNFPRLPCVPSTSSLHSSDRNAPQPHSKVVVNIKNSVSLLANRSDTVAELKLALEELGEGQAYELNLYHGLRLLRGGETLQSLHPGEEVTLTLVRNVSLAERRIDNPLEREASPRNTGLPGCWTPATDFPLPLRCEPSLSTPFTSELVAENQSQGTAESTVPSTPRNSHTVPDADDARRPILRKSDDDRRGRGSSKVHVITPNSGSILNHRRPPPLEINTLDEPLRPPPVMETPVGGGEGSPSASQAVASSVGSDDDSDQLNIDGEPVLGATELEEYVNYWRVGSKGLLRGWPSEIVQCVYRYLGEQDIDGNRRRESLFCVANHGAPAVRIFPTKGKERENIEFPAGVEALAADRDLLVILGRGRMACWNMTSMSFMWKAEAEGCKVLVAGNGYLVYGKPSGCLHVQYTHQDPKTAKKMTLQASTPTGPWRCLVMDRMVSDTPLVAAVDETNELFIWNISNHSRTLIGRKRFHVHSEEGPCGVVRKVSLSNGVVATLHDSDGIHTVRLWGALDGKFLMAWTHPERKALEVSLMSLQGRGHDDGGLFLLAITDSVQLRLFRIYLKSTKKPGVIATSSVPQHAGGPKFLMFADPTCIIGVHQNGLVQWRPDVLVRKDRKRPCAVM